MWDYFVDYVWTPMISMSLLQKACSIMGKTSCQDSPSRSAPILCIASLWTRNLSQASLKVRRDSCMDWSVDLLVLTAFATRQKQYLIFHTLEVLAHQFISTFESLQKPNSNVSMYTKVHRYAMSQWMEIMGKSNNFRIPYCIMKWTRVTNKYQFQFLIWI